jgi:hypothetical protein
MPWQVLLVIRRFHVQQSSAYRHIGPTKAQPKAKLIRSFIRLRLIRRLVHYPSLEGGTDPGSMPTG